MALAFALPRVMVSTEVPFTTIGFAANDLVIVGCVRTVSVAEAATPVPALVVATGSVQLTLEPALPDFTLTVTVHEPLAGTVAPATATLGPLFAGVTLPRTQFVAA